MSNQKGEVEAGSSLLYPSMQESPELRWAFIRKVYAILTVQLLVTIAFAAVVASAHPVVCFFNTGLGIATYVVVMVVYLIVLCCLFTYRDQHPLNFILLGILTLFFGFLLGIACAYVSGKVIIEALIATTVVVISLSVYTFWAAKRGRDFSFLVPLLLSVVVILILFTIFQIFYPMGKFSEMIYSGLCVIVFSAYLIYDTDQLIKRYSYDDYILASISLYLDVLNIFLHMLQILNDR